MKNKTLIIGPITKTHGQGIVTMKVQNFFSKKLQNVHTIDTHYSGSFFIKFLFNLYLLFIISKNIIIFKPKIIYFTPSRSFFGSIRDLNILLFKHYYFNSIKLVGYVNREI